MSSATFRSVARLSALAIAAALAFACGKKDSATEPDTNPTTNGSGAGAATQLSFSVQPASAASGAPISPAVQVRILDASSQLVSTSTATVTLSLTASAAPSGAALSGTVSVAAVAGVATFTDLTVNKAATGYALAATATGLTGTTSSTFDVSPGAATRLIFTTQPATTIVAQATTFVVAIQDAAGNSVPAATNAVTLALAPGTGAAGATLGGTLNVNAVNGVATFSTITVDKAGTGYQLSASASGLTPATSLAFSASAATATKLAFSVQPGGTTGGTAFAPSIQVSVVDAAGNVASGATNSIALAITTGTGTSGAHLTGTTSVTAVAGVATFTNLAIDSAGTGYQVTASTGGLTTATSTAFTVAVGAPAKLRFVTQPTGSTGGTTIAPAVQVVVADAGGNTISSATASVTVAITSGAGTTGAVLSGTKTVAAAQGLARFADLSIDKNGSSYSLTASSPGVASGVSNTFAVNVGAATQLVFSSQAASMTAAVQAPFSVAIADAGGNTVTAATNSVTIALKAGTGTAGATLSSAGGLTRSAVSGVASFSDLKLDKVGTGYQLTAAATGLGSVASAPITVIAGAPARLVLLVAPKATWVNAPLNPDTAVQVAVEDNGGNVVTSATHTIRASIAVGPGSARLNGTDAATLNGIATFPATVSLDTVGTSFQITFSDVSSGGVPPITSNAFAVSAFRATSKLALLVQPSTGGYGVAESPAPKIGIEDQYGNIVATASDSVAFALTTNPSAANLGGAGARAVNGIATFSSLTLDQAGTGFVLTSTDVSTPSLTPLASSPFNVATPGRLNTAAGNVDLFGESEGASLTVTGGSVYWPAGNSINSVSTIGGTVNSLAGSLSGAGLLASDGSSLFWWEQGAGPGSEKISSMPIGGGAITTLATGLSSVRRLLVDGSTLVVLADDAANQRAVFTMPVIGGALFQVSPDTENVETFTAAGGIIYYLNGSNPQALRKVAESGGAATTLATFLNLEGGNADMVVGNASVYLVGSTSISGPVIWSVPTAGGAATIATSLSSYVANSLRIDAGSLYLVTFSGLTKYSLLDFSSSVVNSSTQFREYAFDSQSVYFTDGNFVWKIRR